MNYSPLIEYFMNLDIEHVALIAVLGVFGSLYLIFGRGFAATDDTCQACKGTGKLKPSQLRDIKIVRVVMLIVFGLAALYSAFALLIKFVF